MSPMPKCEDCLAARAIVPWAELALTESEVAELPIASFRSFDPDEHTKNNFCPKCGHPINWDALLPNSAP